MSLGADQLAGLAKVKLEALVRGAFPDVTADAESFSAGVAILDGHRAFVYLVADEPSPLAAALAWGTRVDASELHVVVDEPDAVLAVMASGLEPVPTLWQAAEADLVPMPASELPALMDPPDSAMAHTSTLAAAGCEVVVEHGVVIGEINGLEVARVVVEPDGRALVRVGVGLYDQEAHALLHGDSPVEDRLEQVIAEVRAHRNSTAAPHPLNRVARERWLRSALLGEPAAIGLTKLAPVCPLVPREGIRGEYPVAAIGAAGGNDVLVVCATGIDLDLVPVAAAHVKVQAATRAILVLPPADRHPILEAMAGHLSVPAEFVDVATPWAS